MLAVSSQAPNGWDSDYSEDAIRRIVLHAQPDWIFYQEIPSHVPFAEGYSLIREQTDSHCGSIVTLVREELTEHEPMNHETIPGCAVLSVVPRLDLTLANVHLAPGKSGAAMRLHMLKQILGATETSRVVVIGDTNTRIDEEKAIAELGFSTDRPPIPTWNTKDNKFRDGSREYSAYYTRYFAIGRDVSVEDAKVHNVPMNVDGNQFFLSDHYLLSGNIMVDSDELD